MKKTLSVYSTVILISLIFSPCLLLASCNEAKEWQAANATASGSTEILEDKGDEYIDSFVFFGESTTYHLKSRGVLKNGRKTLQVWGTESGTAKLDMTISSLPIVYPETEELLSVSEAVRKKRPPRIFLCFGLNGAAANIKRGKDYFKTCYRQLIDEIRKESPSTEIFLASAYPIAKSMDMSKHSVDAKTLNEYIATENEWTRELAEERGAVYLDVASVLVDDGGFLREEYHVGDGYHLSFEAYERILLYIRTH